jgi:putative AbiEii toxin of type IV toxin-antitoxin system
LTPSVVEAAQMILGRDIAKFTHMKIGPRGKITLLAGRTPGGVKYSEFHFGAGESSVIRMAIRLETAQQNALVLVEEIENGLHPLATIRMVEYLLDVAERKKIQVIFTTHSEDALLPLPPEAIWAAVDRRAFQGRLSVHSLRAITSEIDAKLAVFTEDGFAADWMRGMLRSERVAVMDLIEIHATEGDGIAVAINKHHNQDPSSRFPSVCMLDGDSKQAESKADMVFKLPGQTPESTVFAGVIDRIDECSGKLAVALHWKYEDEKRVREMIEKVRLTNRDPHLLFSQIGERLGLVPETVVRGAFISTWCGLYPEAVRKTVAQFDALLPSDNSHI